MKQVNKLTQLNTASFFTKLTLSQVIGANDEAVSANIKRWLKNGNLIQLKKGCYVTKDYVQTLINKESYYEFIANILKKPSYLSTEYVLQKYSMLTESVFAITSVTRKKTKMYQNKLGTFLYSNIKEELFTGFKIVDRDGFQIKEATKAKALFDFFYFRLWKVSEISKELIESYRLNLFEMQTNDFDELESFILLSTIERFKTLPNILKEIANDS
ncbi:MAG: hypothetical protein PHD83_03665 [Caldisericia bacterium]|nr:hypothetical protein [Caldisericia bacterium]